MLVAGRVLLPILKRTWSAHMNWVGIGDVEVEVEYRKANTQT
jgi:hypothetical protein